MAAVVRKDYWYYDNGAYELQARHRAGGEVEQVRRHISGPMPQNQIYTIIQLPQPIDPEDPNWRETMVQRLQDAQFNTENIVEGLPTECGVTVKAYAKSFLTWKTAATVSAVAGGVVLLAYSPALIAKYTPEAAARLGMPELGKQTLLQYSKKCWYTVLVPGKPETLSQLLLGSVQSCAIAGVSKVIFDALNETCGPKHFRAWKVEKMNIFIQHREILIPEAFENDQVLSENECYITNMPIRVPMRTPYGHVYEQAAITAWITQQMNNDLPTTCPYTVQRLTLQDLTFDVQLSDTIELRLLLLKSLQQH